MNCLKKRDNISLVLLGKFSPVFINGDWLRINNLITEKEWNEYDNNRTKLTLLPNLVRFIIDPIEFSFESGRIQIVSNDISLSEKIAQIVASILTLQNSYEVNAIGVNAEKIITFNSEEDGYKFGKYFFNLGILDQFMNGPRVKQFTIEENITANAIDAKKSFMVSSFGTEEKKIKLDGNEKTVLIPLVSLSINNHFSISKSDEIEHVLSITSKLHSDFEINSDELINSIK